MSAPLLEGRHLCVRFAARRADAAPVTALDDVSLALRRGQCLGLVGESGSGKSTLARVLVGLQPPDAGEVRLAGESLRTDTRAARRRTWSRLQYVHQNPQGALNPRLRVGRLLEGPLESLLGLGRAERARRVARVLERVGLGPETVERHPHAFSGGQAQRIAIARALVVEPEVLLLDEPTSALDVRVQARILALLDALRRELGTTLVFVSHDLAVVEGLCDEVAVMRGGHVLEQGPREQIFGAPRHPWTRALLDAVPVPGRRRGAALPGEAPDTPRPGTAGPAR